MKDIITIIKEKEDAIYGDGTTEETVINAENELQLRFAEDYRRYLKELCIAAFDGHELTGLSKNTRTNVVCVTQENKKINDHMVQGFYVIEENGIDGIVLWQDKSGNVYQTQGDGEPEKIFKSLTEYIKKA